ncbi:MAG: hypothetical protein IPM11_01450 [Micropruina sp.]|nr:hypothetical protein [Micropruina sp.]
MGLNINLGITTLRQGAMDGLADAMEHVLNVSNSRVPHEYGDLQASGVASTDSGALEGAVSYDTPYAVRQHEELSYHHDPGRTAKFLENAANSEAGGVRTLIARATHRRVGD